MLIELLPPHTGRAFAAIRELRTHLASEQAFVTQVDDVQRRDGYRLIASVTRTDGAALAVAGFRQNENLAWGRHLYIDDLATLPAARGQGHAGRLLEWLRQEAVRLDCGQIHLDSGVGAQRADAHRLYLSAGYQIASHHFRLLID